MRALSSADAAAAPPLTVAVLERSDTDPVTWKPIRTTTNPLGTTGSENAQVTSLCFSTQAAPGSVITWYDSPAGIVMVTVNSPSVDFPPMFSTTTSYSPCLPAVGVNTDGEAASVTCHAGAGDPEEAETRSGASAIGVSVAAEMQIKSAHRARSDRITIINPFSPPSCRLSLPRTFVARRARTVLACACLYPYRPSTPSRASLCSRASFCCCPACEQLGWSRSRWAVLQA